MSKALLCPLKSSAVQAEFERVLPDHGWNNYKARKTAEMHAGTCDKERCAMWSSWELPDGTSGGYCELRNYNPDG